jgi:hypothetical protein
MAMASKTRRSSRNWPETLTSRLCCLRTLVDAVHERLDSNWYDESRVCIEVLKLASKRIDAEVLIGEFADASDFWMNLIVFENILDVAVSRKSAERSLLHIQIGLAMIYHYGTVEGGNHDVALRAYEIALLKIYGWMHRDKLLADKRLAEQLTSTINAYFVVSIEYLAKLDPLVDVYHGLARTGWHETVEYPLRVMKTGALAGQWMIFVGRIAAHGQLPNELNAAGEFIAKFLTRLRSSCPPVERPLFDHQMTDVCLMVVGLHVLGGPALAVDYLNSVISRLCLENMNGNPLPEGVGDFEAVAKLLMENKVVEWYSKASSTLVPMLAEMCALLDAEPLYELIYRTWQGKVNFQTIYLNGLFIEWACDGGQPAIGR